jgi:F-type H+-transporting ATPase subunit gamma
MPSLKSLRKRIATVRSTQITSRGVAAISSRARLRARARPYADKLVRCSARSWPTSKRGPLLARRDGRRIEIVVVTSRGLCGGYNSNLLRKAGRSCAHGKQSSCRRRRKAVESFRRRGTRLAGEQTDVMKRPAIESARAVAHGLTERFAAGETDAVYLLYSRFRSAISQIPTIRPLLPVAKPEASSAQPVEYIFEPERPELLAALRYIETLSCRHPESFASSTAPAAAVGATTNASEMIGRLTLSMNRARQSAITTELMEIVSGAEALKG